MKSLAVAWALRLMAGARATNLGVLAFVQHCLAKVPCLL